MMKTKIHATAFCAWLFCASAIGLVGQDYSIDWFKVAGGGNASTSPVYSISGTIGQADAGAAMSGGNYSVSGGFWVLPTLIQTPGAPTLHVAKAAPGLVTLWWTPVTPGFVLQSSDSLTPANWVNAPSGTNTPVAVSAALPMKFYRLLKP